MHEERCEDRAEVAVEARPCARKAAASLEAEKRKETDSVPAPWWEHGPDNLGLGAHETVSRFWPPEVEDSQFVPC